MSYEIFTDSTANLPNQIIERFKLNVIPVPVIVNGEITYSYEKDGKNDLKVFYDRLRKKESISTSCINEEAFAEAFEKTLEKGSDILYVAFSSALSVTCANGKAVAQRLAEKYPERKIFVVDSLGACGRNLSCGGAVCEKRLGKENGRLPFSVLHSLYLRTAHFFAAIRFDRRRSCGAYRVGVFSFQRAAPHALRRNQRGQSTEKARRSGNRVRTITEIYLKSYFLSPMT